MLPPSASLLAAILLSVSSSCSAAPQTNGQTGQTMPLKKRAPPARTEEEWGVWAKNHREGLEAKYGNPKHDKRATGTNLYARFQLCLTTTWYLVTLLPF